MRLSKKWIGIGVGVLALVMGGWLVLKSTLDDAFAPGPTNGPFTADTQCPAFQTSYPACDIRFGNSGLSTLNSFSETFLGEGAFEIERFDVETFAPRRLTIVAQSNRGPLTSRIVADRVVRLGQEQEDGEVNRTHQSAFCDGGRIYEHQVGYAQGDQYVQDLQFWEEDGNLRFRLFQDGSATADVMCSPASGGKDAEQ